MEIWSYKEGMHKKNIFSHFANMAGHVLGKPISFIIAVIVVVVWAVTGHMFHYSDTWQLVINTGTTVVTFLMVFLIQNTQNRDSTCVQIKLDELIRSIEPANNSLLDLESLSQEELEDIRGRYLDLAAQARDELKKREDEAN